MSTVKLNRNVLSVFAPVLILTGVAGFLIPSHYSLTSGAAPYNLFHILFGAIGLFLVSTNIPQGPILFNIGFGLIDLYQAVASVFYLPPQRLFMWTFVDDLLHVVLGVALVLIGLSGILKRNEENK